MTKQKFTLKKRLKSFTYAFNGMRILFRDEHNARIHLLAAVCAIASGVILKINLTEWIIICFAIGFVFAAEIFNSAIEKLCDFVSPGKDERIKKIKDLSAFAVLFSAATALIAGLIIFLPKIIALC
ncbi:MAG: diacylglycerol kinase family protein [Bacteroidota bacterium]